MGNRIVKACLCNAGAGAGAGAGDISGSFDNRISFHSNQYNKTLGNSICYVRPDPSRFAGDVSSDDDITLMTFRSVCGATVSANSSSTPSTSLEDSLRHSTVMDSSASFESSGSFTPTMVPLQLQHRHDPRGFSVGSSMERGLSWSPVMGRFMPSPRDRILKGDPIEKVSEPLKKQKKSLKQILSRAFFNTLSLGKRFVPKENENANNARVSCSTSSSGELSLHGVESDKCLGGGGGGELLMGCQNLHWAQGRAGEDRVHVVICEDHGWVFVGIYDGFNGPDATDYLLNNLFYAVNDELKSVLCSSHNSKSMANTSNMAKSRSLEEKVLLPVKGIGVVDGCCSSGFHKEKINLDGVSKRVEGMNRRNSNNKGDGEKVDIEKRMKVNLSQAKSVADFSHSDVLQALSEALSKTEDAFLKIVDEMITHNAELAMMGSCVLVMLLKGEDVYLMNVGDSRAVLATQTGNSLQLTMEHSTHIKEEVYRIRKEHPDDPSAVTKGRVKGYLSVTRAFGVGFLKRPKQNNALLESFKVSYKGESPYITCDPSLNHHRLSPNDKFLILSSDGLYQYFTNEEAVTIVESFITLFPDKDPAQFLIEEALSRAAKKAGIEFHELLDIPHGERRLYHDDISIVIISLEGKIWRSLA